jgi:hypothetical protein
MGPCADAIAAKPGDFQKAANFFRQPNPMVITVSPEQPPAGRYSDSYFGLHSPQIRIRPHPTLIAMTVHPDPSHRGIPSGRIEHGSQAIPRVKDQAFVFFQPTGYFRKKTKQLSFRLNVVHNVEQADGSIHTCPRQGLRRTQQRAKALAQVGTVPFLGSAKHGRIRIHRRHLKPAPQEYFCVSPRATARFQDSFGSSSKQLQGLGNFLGIGLFGKKTIVDIVKSHE